MESNRDYQEDVKMWLENAAEKTRGEDGGTSIRGVIVPGGVRAGEIVPEEFLDKKLEGLKRLAEAYHAEDGWTPELSPTVEAVVVGYQEFWKRTPQAFADIILAEFEKVTRNFCYEVLCGDSSDDIPKWLNILPNASAQEIFSGYDDAGRKVVSDALQSDRLQYSQEYIKAKWVPLVEKGILENLTDEERIIIRSGIRLLPDEGINRGLVLLFCSIYVQVDDDTQIAMAKAIGLDDNTTYERIMHHTDIPNVIDFGPAARRDVVDENSGVKDAGESSRKEGIIKKIATSGRQISTGLEVGTSYPEQWLPTFPINKSFTFDYPIRDNSKCKITMEFKRPVDERTGDGIQYTETDSGIIKAWHSLRKMGYTEATDEAIYRQWKQDFKSDVSKFQKDLVYRVMLNATLSGLVIDEKQLKSYRQHLPNIFATVGNLVYAKRELRKVNGEDIGVWVAVDSKGKLSLSDFSDQIGQTRFVGDKKILDADVIRMRSICVSENEVDADGEAKTTVKAVINPPVIRDMILKALYAIDSVKEMKEGQKVTRKGHTGNLNLAKILTKGGFSYLLQGGRENKNNYRTIGKVNKLADDYIRLLYNEGYIKDFKDNGKRSEKAGTIPTSDYTITTVPGIAKALQHGKQSLQPLLFKV